MFSLCHFARCVSSRILAPEPCQTSGFLQLQGRQRKKAAKFEKKRQQKKETQEDLAVEEEPGLKDLMEEVVSMRLWKNMMFMN